MSRKSLSTILQLIVFTGLGVWIIYYMAGKMSAVEKQQMYDSLRQTRLWVFIPVFILGFLSHWFRALRWKLLLAPMGINPSTLNTLLSVLIGYVTNLFLPRMGEVAKCTVLARYEKVPVDKLVGTIVAERLFDMVCLLLLVGATLVLQRDVIGDFLHNKLGSVNLGGGIVITGIILLILGAGTIIYILTKHVDSKIAQFIRGIGDGLMSILRLEKRGMFLLHTFLIWFCYGSLVQLGFWSLPATEHLGPMAALVVLVFGSFGMIATQGGIGAYTYLCAEILVFYGIHYGDGTAFGWLSWLVQTGIIVVLGITALIALPIVNRKNHGQTSVDKPQNT